MAKLLIVDDDNSQCMRLGFSCSARGHAVEMATKASVAIEKGLRFCPDVLITDWMLDAELDGIDVTDVIRGIHPHMHSILVTAFASKDVREAALQARMFGFFEKPIDHDKIFAAIDKAIETPPLPVEADIGCMEFDRGGKIVQINNHALELLGVEEITPGSRLCDWFTYRSLVFIEAADKDWLGLNPIQDTKKRIQGFVIRGQRKENTDLIILLDKKASDAKESKSVRLLTHSKQTSQSVELGAEGSVLIVDSDNLQRNLASTQLRLTGRRFYTAESHERALKTVEADPELCVVLLDYGNDQAGPAKIVEAMREANPDVLIVGTSSAYRKPQFEQLGVDHFLLKPILATTLSELLAVAQSSPA